MNTIVRNHTVVNGHAMSANEILFSEGKGLGERLKRNAGEKTGPFVIKQ